MAALLTYATVAVFIILRMMMILGKKKIKDHPLAPLLKRMNSDTIHFSGRALEEDHAWWTLVTATLDHANWSHLANNALMLVCMGPELEQLCGLVFFLVLFTATGAAGWLLNLFLLKWQYQGDDWNYVAKFQSSVGSSTATYGMAGFLALYAPSTCVVGALGCPSWVWLALLFFFPCLVTDH